MLLLYTVLTMVRDYTKLGIGTKLEAGEIQKCPKCGKHGLHEANEGIDWYIHQEGINFTKQGSFDLVLNMCPVPKPQASSEQSV